MRDTSGRFLTATIPEEGNLLGRLERPITVCARQRPEWLQVVCEEPGVEEADLASGLDYYATVEPETDGPPIGH